MLIHRDLKARDLIDKVEGDVSCLTADAAYDTRGIYEASGARGATVLSWSTDQVTATVYGRAVSYDRPMALVTSAVCRHVQQAKRLSVQEGLRSHHQQANVRKHAESIWYKLSNDERIRCAQAGGARSWRPSSYWREAASR